MTTSARSDGHGDGKPKEWRSSWVSTVRSGRIMENRSSGGVMGATGA